MLSSSVILFLNYHNDEKYIVLKLVSYGNILGNENALFNL